MKIAVITDIHSNHAALKAALDTVDSLKADGIVFLGDYVTDCPYPQKTMTLLYEYREKYPCWFIRGNREEYLLNHHKNPNDGWCYSSGTGALLYTYENLSDADLAFFESMPIRADIELQGCSAIRTVITVCHGSPTAAGEFIKDNDELIRRYLNEIKGGLLICGHSHEMGEYRYGGRTALFLPSLLPSKGLSNSMFVFDFFPDGWKYNAVPIEWDVEELIREFDESGLLDKAGMWARATVKAIRTGYDYPFYCLNLAHQKAQKDGFSGGALPEKYWNAAGKELGII